MRNNSSGYWGSTSPRKPRRLWLSRSTFPRTDVPWEWACGLDDSTFAGVEMTAMAGPPRLTRSPAGAGRVRYHSCLLRAPIAPMLVALERMSRADVAPGQEHGAVLLVAGRVEDVAEIDRFAQAFLDPPDESLVCLRAAGHR